MIYVYGLNQNSKRFICFLRKSLRLFLDLFCKKSKAVEPYYARIFPLLRALIKRGIAYLTPNQNTTYPRPAVKTAPIMSANVVIGSAATIESKIV